MLYTKSGIPFIKDTEIEKIAYKFLSEYDDFSLSNPIKAPIGGLLNYLKENHKVLISYSDLGFNGDYKVFGRTIYSKNKIFIDESIVYDNEPLFLSTGAHEIGHWVLHRNRKITLDRAKDNIDQIETCEKDIKDVYGKKKLITEKDWREHHAKVFAASLLMPRVAFMQATINAQESIGISRRGKIYINNTLYSQKDYEKIISYLEDIFGTSWQSIDIRLKELDLVIDEIKRPRPITEIFKRVV